MIRQFLRWILGESLATSELSQQKYNVFWGLPLLSSDAISSIAYAVEEMLWVLVPVAGLASYLWLPRIAGVIILLLFILIFSYRQTVDAYPNGGGSYIVAKENLGTLPGLIAGASLSVDYTLTVAVSISAGAAAITSAYPPAYPYRVIIASLMIVLMVIGNLRGIRESSKLFSFPTYAFVGAVLALIIAGIIGHHPAPQTLPAPAVSSVTFGTQMVTLFLLLKAFSSGCSALTGVEAIANAVPNFQPPEQKNAKLTYLILGLTVLVTFGGIAYLAKIYQAVPNPHETVISQIAIDVFGKSFMYYIIQITTAVILVMAANTAFAGFPMLLSVIAQNGFAPRQLALRGHRLNYSNGILVLAGLALVLVIVFQSDTHLLIPLYSIGVFTSFTLSQVGMLVHWIKRKPPGWKHRAVINGIGALVTITAVAIIGYEKFLLGAWIVFVVVPLLVILMFKIHQHYDHVAQKLDVSNDQLNNINFKLTGRHHVIVPIDSLNVMVINALKYASSMTANVEAFHVEVTPGEADKLRRKWAMLKTDIPLIIKPSPYREIVRPLLKYIDSEEHQSRPGDVITVLLPQFIVSKWWQLALHNNTSVFIANSLFHKENLVVSVLPFFLGENDHKN
ncbi:MAG TPA: APC family permease [Syntrophomonadaceae bacterium]|nr:APC family permease [Syntrophomonadaceae bacterium]